MIENSMYESSVEMPRVPRSMSRDTPPVWRSRWKRSDRQCRWRNTCSATRRIARWATRTNTTSRSSANSVVESAQQPVGDEQRERQRQHRLLRSSASTISFSTSGTPTLASLAVTRKASASSTRPLNSHR